VILDTRGYEAPVETLETMISETLKELGGEVTGLENIGRHDFVRITEKGHTGDTYLIVAASGDASLPGAFQERVRLDKKIKRVMVQSV
jgi:small subunit ribosomal protein S6